MGAVSKNARTSSTTQRFYCPAGGEIVMRTVVVDGKAQNQARCERCGQVLRRPGDFTECYGAENSAQA
jgi:predicted RNA-binding Zn-ribbon protein involved in translation (DUF1610 family)